MRNNVQAVVTSLRERGIEFINDQRGVGVVRLKGPTE